MRSRQGTAIAAAAAAAAALHACGDLPDFVVSRGGPAPISSPLSSVAGDASAERGDCRSGGLFVAAVALGGMEAVRRRRRGATAMASGASEAVAMGPGFGSSLPRAIRGPGAALAKGFMPEDALSLERGDRVARGMKLAYWMYTGPAHIGTLRVASSFKNVHAIMHAPLGDDYFNVMRSMLERSRDFTPVTASIVDRHVLARGSQEKVVDNITRKDKEDKPDLILLTPTCTSSILQEDLANFCKRASETTSSDVILADVNHYRVNEHQASDRTLAQVVTFYLEKAKNAGKTVEKTARPSANIIGTFTLGFHNSHDCRELKRLLRDLGIDTNLVVPEGASVQELQNLPKAWFNIVPYREVGLMSAHYLKEHYNMPMVDICPMV